MLLVSCLHTGKLAPQKTGLGTFAHPVSVDPRTRSGAYLINCYMAKRCSSANRCVQIGCNTCARRYARRIARDFQCRSTGTIYATSIAADIDSIDDFRLWRVSLWNVVSYRKSGCRWWRDIHIRVWCCRDGCIRGIVALESVTEKEFLTALGSRWPITLRQITPEALRDELYTVVHPDIIMGDYPDHARYQHRQMTVRPSHARAKSIYPADAPVRDPFDDPMPLLIA